MKRHFLIKILFFTLFSCASAQTAFACSCAAPGNALEAFEGAGNVVVLKAVSVEKIGKDENLAMVDGIKSAKMVVEKVYKGKLKVGDEIDFAQGGGADCIWTFSAESVGSRYLFYLDKGDKTKAIWRGFVCGRSSTIEGAADDLLFLEKLDKVRGKTRISGKIEFEGYREMAESPSPEGRKVRITASNGRTYNLKTDKNGVYEIYDLPPGRYRIAPEMPKGWKVNQYYLSLTDVLGIRRDDDDDKTLKNFFVNLQRESHAAVDFHLEIDNAIRGKILAPDGSLMRGLCVRLYPPSGIDKDFGYHTGCVERDSDSFEIREVPPGRYILVVNEENKITSDAPFKTLYYPGVFELEKASVINVGIGESLENVDINVPQLAELITVHGVLRYSDGKPAAGVTVRFNADGNAKEYDNEARVMTDGGGGFTLKILKGMKGTLYGAMYVYLGEFEKCPAVDALIRAGGKTNLDAKTPAVEISGETDVFDVELKFPFPDCKKSKE